MKTLTNRSLLALTTTLMLVAASATASQDGGRHGDRDGRRGPPDAEMRVAKMTRMLNLSDEQSAQLLVVMQEADLERDALHEQMMEQFKPQICDMRLRTESDISGILTAEQLAQLEEKKASRNEKGRHRDRRGQDNVDCSEFE